MPEHRDPKVLAENAEPLAEHGGDRKSGQDQGDNITLKPSQKGTSSAYLTRRIARDRPDILEEMKAGKYPSVHVQHALCSLQLTKEPMDRI